MPFERICPTCKKPFSGDKKNRIYCSRQCSNARAKRYFVCEVCGKSFYAPKWRFETAKYCSRQCKIVGLKGKTRITKGRQRAPRIISKCLYCGEKLILMPHRKHQKFCSSICSNRYYRKDKPANNKKEPTIIKCPICNKSFTAIPSNHDAKYCSKKCFYKFKANQIGEKSPHWRGGISYYINTPDWPKIAKAIRRRDKQRCTHCRMSNAASIKIYGKNLEVHHIVPYILSQDNSPSNLKTLCVKCHKWAEHQFAWLL